MTVPVLDFGSAVTAPQRPFCETQGISLSLLTNLFAQGEVDSVIIGGRFRHVVLPSWANYVRRRQLGLERDPAEREAAAKRYRDSVSPTATLAAKRALAGKPRPGRPPGSGTKHRNPNHPGRSAAQSAAPARRASPPPVAAPKTAPGKPRSSRKETVAPAQ
jgi:hypothetical protein